MNSNNKSSEWFEDQDFWLNYSSVMFDSQRWAEARGVADSICKIAGLDNGRSILDACCGPGRISIELALKGLNVTGVDITQPFLDAAEETACDEGVKINLINHDMRTFQSEKPFDAAINIYNSFGYCDKIEDDTKILKQIYLNLKKGGTFILECISRETAIKYFTEGEWFERDELTVLTQFDVTGLWEGLSSKWILMDKKGRKMEHTFVQRLYSAVELKERLLNIGFSSVEVYGGFDMRPYDQNAITMVIKAVK